MSNDTKDKLLGQSFGAASNRLRKLVLWSLVQETGKDVCFRCGQRIGDVDDLSIEHKAPWQSVPDPKASFFDLENIAFSHLRCNSGARIRTEYKEQCDQGHQYTPENTYRGPDGKRHCRICRLDWRRRDLRKGHQRKR